MTPDSSLLRQLDDRFDEIRRNVRQQLDKDRRTMVGGLAKGFRRLRSYRNEGEWIAALLDTANAFCSRNALFTVNSGKLEWKAARGFQLTGPLPVFAIADAAAFSAAIESREVTVALSGSREISSTLAHALGEDGRRKVVLVPISSGERVAAVLYAEDAEPEGLELVCGFAGTAIDAKSKGAAGMINAASPAANGLLQIGLPANTAKRNAEEEMLHLRAQRLARKLAAEIRLHESDAVKAGRTSGDLYEEAALKPRIDQARETYRNQFLAGTSTNMVDYLHQEFVRTLANGDEDLLGAEYPGPME